MLLSRAEVVQLLGLQPHSTCGLVSETYRSDLAVPAEALPAAYAGARPLGGVLYFLITPQAPVRLHRIQSDQMYHHYLGEPLEVVLLYPDGWAPRCGRGLSRPTSRWAIPGGWPTRILRRGRRSRRSRHERGRAGQRLAMRARSWTSP
jgi:predicted cupin superfamily sugar epimerase